MAWVLAELDAVAGVEELAAAWANTEPERATPATSKEAIASLRIMMSTLEWMIANPAGTRRHGWRDNLTLAADGGNQG